jgi:hypothetical protein
MQWVFGLAVSEEVITEAIGELTVHCSTLGSVLLQSKVLGHEFHSAVYNGPAREYNSYSLVSARIIPEGSTMDETQSRLRQQHRLCKGEQSGANNGFLLAPKVDIGPLQATQSEVLARHVEQGFGQHPDAEIYRSQPGLGVILGARPGAALRWRRPCGRTLASSIGG